TVSWPDLHRWSVSEVGEFWQTVSDFCGIKWLERGGGKAYSPPAAPGAAGQAATAMARGRAAGRRGSAMTDARWFEGARLNFAHNLLPPPTDDEAGARFFLVIVSVSESPDLPSRRLTGNELRVCARALRSAGVRKGDRVAGVMVNSQEALVCMLGATSIGAVWSSCSPDFGVGGVSDRLGQISPKLVFFSLGYLYSGRWFDCRKLALDVLARLPADTEHGRPRGVGVPYWTMDNSAEEGAGGRGVDPDPLPVSDLPAPLLSFDEFLFGAASGEGVRDGRNGPGDEVINFEPTPFDHPVFIMFSSGTTGLPKCMVHGAGAGTLLQQKKELELHCDYKRGDRMLFFSTLGWMMWNWAAAALSVEGTTLVAFDGSPGHPDLSALWRVASREGVTHLGASPKYFGACKQRSVVPSTDCAADGEGLGRLRAILSTGSPLLPEHFQWIYQAVKPDVHLASISGGTDILGCFALGNPTLPVRAGHLQCLGLGMDVCAYRSHEGDGGGGGDGAGDGVRTSAASLRVAATGQMGELVCRTPFPSMPVCFWGDSDGSKYRSAYFEAFEGEEVWAHGDYIKVTEEGGVVISGRSDAVLNPGGVRIGTAEIYRQASFEMVPEVEDSVAVGLRADGDVEVVLFVKLVPIEDGAPTTSGDGQRRGECYALAGDLERKIKEAIRSNLTARHVPARMIVVDDIPYTRSGKKVNIGVT
ncbi:unnamed protein product, partial [Laminaria digitata]